MMNLVEDVINSKAVYFYVSMCKMRVWGGNFEAQKSKNVTYTQKKTSSAKRIPIRRPYKEQRHINLHFCTYGKSRVHERQVSITFLQIADQLTEQDTSPTFAPLLPETFG